MLNEPEALLHHLHQGPQVHQRWTLLRLIFAGGRSYSYTYKVVTSNHRNRRNGRGEFEEDITVERDRLGGGDREVAALRSRSRSTARRRHYDDKLEEEADYYNRKAMERAYVGEAYNGATRDWSIVDVPPGTERVKMDGAGGSSQEISWQRYNGVRRSKFLAGDREFDSGFGMPDHRAHAPPLASLGPPARIRPSDMWTEITKDLVIKEAIQAQGYQFEETEFFYYVMEYLRYVSQETSLDSRILLNKHRRMFSNLSKSRMRSAATAAADSAKSNGSERRCVTATRNMTSDSTSTRSLSILAADTKGVS